MTERQKKLVAVVLGIIFLIGLFARISLSSDLAAIDARLEEIRRVGHSSEEIALLQEEYSEKGNVVSLITLGLIVSGLALLYFMNAGLANRVGFALLTVALVAFITYTLIRVMPGDPIQQLATELVRERGLSYEDAVNMAYTLLDYDPEESFLEGFADYMAGVLRFEFGYSWVYHVSVNKIIARALPWTLLVLSISLMLSFAIGILLGMAIAWKRRTALDPIITFYAAFTGATPDYVTALVLLIVFAVNLRWFPLSGGYDPTLDIGFNWPFIASVLYHAFLPILAYTFENTAAWALAMKGSAVSTLGEDYVMAARARGLRDRRIMVSYVGRNALLPMITGLAIALGSMLGGSTLIENIYNYPGIGRFNAEALVRRDLGMMQGLFLFQAMAVIFANLMADLLYTRLDPRIKLED